MAFKTLVTRTAKTEEAYRQRLASLIAMAARETFAEPSLPATALWFVSQHERWRRATVAQYRASLQFGAGEALHAGGVSARMAEQLTAVLANGPRHKVGGVKLTSSRKRKTLPDADIDALIASIRLGTHRLDRLLRAYIAFSIIFFPRPSEWATARIEGSYLLFENAKNTNGRSHGRERSLSISGLDLPSQGLLAQFLRDMTAHATSEGSHAKLMTLLAARLARHSKQAGITRVAPYTLRHLGMATAKRFLQIEEVAAAAGHGSSRTASEHYAKRRYGRISPTFVPRPAAEDVARVRRTAKAFKVTANQPKSTP